VASISQIILKKASMEEHGSFIKEYLNAKVIIGYGLMFVSTILTILAFKGLDYKNGPIIESAGYIMVMVLSQIFLSEKITKKKILGNAMILLGIFVFYA
jgi:drug/metabolite transporter (DMT)-like permease